MSGRLAVRVALLALIGLVPVGCGKDIQVRSYDPPAERSAANWSTWVAGNPAALRVPPPPGAAQTEKEKSELKRIADSRTLSQEREARFWGLEPTVRPWLATALNKVTRRNRNDPVAAARAYALVSVAMYDAAVSASHWKYKYGRKPPPGSPLLPRGHEPSYPSEHAAIAGAAARVLAYTFPESQSGEFDSLAREAGRSRIVAGTNYPSDVEAGLNLGRAVGDAVVRRGRDDGSSRKWDGQRPRGRGFWEPPPGSPVAPIQPLAGGWRPWVLGSGDRLRPPAPPPFASPEMRAQSRTVMEVGNRLTARQKAIATRWEGGAGTPSLPGRWNQVALTRVDRRGLGIARTARLFAMLNVALADAGVAAWDSKYQFWYPRPENAIRDLGLNRAWKPFLATPLSPAYVSGHSAMSSAAARVLSAEFPDTAKAFGRKSVEAGRSRIYGGVQYPSGDQAGANMGKKVGDLVLERGRRDRIER